MMLLIDSALKASLVLAVGLAVAAALRRRPAALRHWVLASTLACAAAVPLIAVAVPAWRLPMMTSAETIPAVGLESAAPRETAVGTRASENRASSASPQSTVEAFDAAAIALAVWLAGALLSLLVLAAGMLRLARLSSNAKAIDGGPWRQACNATASRLGIARSIRFLQSDHPHLLVTLGALRPSILLPRGAGAWSADRSTVVVAHELAHIRRGDWLVLLLAAFVRAVYWFNPLVWIACRRLDRESELACDDAVLAGGVKPAEYATHLFELAAQLAAGAPRLVPASPIVTASFLEKRIATMLNHRVNRTPIGSNLRLLTAAALVVIAAAVASAQVSFATISGVVADQNGGLIPNATIAATHVASGTKHELRSNAAGAFELVGLTAGDYQLDVFGPGFAGYKETLTVSPGQTIVRNVQLKVGSLEETITVVDGPDAPSSPRRAPDSLRQPKPCTPSGAGGQIRPPRKTADVRPRYPQNLRAEHAEGVVQMQAVIGADGTIKEVHVISSPYEDLSASATEAVRQWEFTPTLLNCTPIEVNMSVRVNFRASR
jgi:TonB family protein